MSSFADLTPGSEEWGKLNQRRAFLIHKRPTDLGLTVACFNCNLGRQSTGGICPHAGLVTEDCSRRGGYDLVEPENDRQFNINSYAREVNFAAKMKALEIYGNSRCLCCGEENKGLLTLDHEKDIGRKRKTGGSVFCLELQRQGWPKDQGIRVMCFNCNCGRASNCNVCPHTQLFDYRSVRRTLA